MKRILCAVLALVMVAGFAGCKQETTETEPIMASSEEFTEETIEETEEETEESTEEETVEETEDPSEPTETTEETVPPCANHSWGYWVQLEAPTTSAEGKRVRTCTVCGTEDVEVLEKLPKPSSHTHKYKTETSKASCKEDGWVYYYCSCGDWYQVEEKAKDHTWGDWKITKPATPDSKGERTRTCKKCKETETETIAYCKDGEHNWGNWTFKPRASVQYNRDGVKVRTCKICGGEEKITVPLCAEDKHDFTPVKHQAATPTTDEYYYKECKICGYAPKTKIIHSWGEWKLTEPATDSSPGKETRTCSKCKKTETRDVPKHDCNYQIVASQPATCTEPGFEHQQCSICGKEIPPTDIPALGHVYGEDGLCTRCGAAKPAEGGGSQETQDPSDGDTDNKET